MRDLNLARRPFLNLRPVKRAGALLVAVGLALFGLNALLYWRHFTGESETRSRSQELARQLADEEAEIARLRHEIAGLGIDGLNRKAQFINAEIDRRRFGWSRLFDHVVEVQPAGVRLVSLVPRFPEQRRRATARPADEGVSLDIRGVARTGAEILRFIDGLFGHPAFSNPDLSRESRRQDGTVDFALTVVYTPGAATGAETVEASEEASADPEPGAETAAVETETTG